jgi:hypothetical protein
MVIRCLKRSLGLLSLFTCAALMAHGPARAQISEGVAARSSDRMDVVAATAIAKDVYIYGYSLLTSEITRVQMTNVAKMEGLKAPMGRMINVKRYPPADYRGVTAPNADTLYSLGWMDVGAEPWVFSHPDMEKRFFLFPFYSMWMTVIDVPGTRTGGGDAASYAVTGPGWSGTLPEGVKEIKSPTRYVLVLGRTYSTGTAEDYEIVNALQDQYHLSPLSNFDETYTPPPAKVNPNPGFSMTEKVRDVIGGMSISEYFNMMARLMKDNPPLPQDGPIVADMAKIGLVPGQDFDLGKLPLPVQKALQDVPKAAYAQILEHYPQAGRNENGWIYSYPTGRYGTNYLQRALIADLGYPANLPQDAVYPVAKVDQQGQTLSGKNKYFVHFDKGQLPPANGFWSITMYDPEWFFVANPLNRFTVSLRDQPTFNSDGSLDFYFQNESPGVGKEANWLPAPKGDFIVMMRLYWPSEVRPSIIDGSWIVPPVVMSTQ